MAVRRERRRARTRRPKAPAFPLRRRAAGCRRVSHSPKAAFDAARRPRFTDDNPT
jgi:hypothetical protein